MTAALPAQLVALAEGLSAHAEPLVCDDLRGQLSLFGEAHKVPRPLAAWNPCALSADERQPKSDYTPGHLLWESDVPDASPEALAETILASTEGEKYPWPLALDLPSVTYIAGKSVSSFSLAWQLAHDGLLPEWGAVLCSCQTGGRGQLRRPWYSPRGNLYVSFRLPADSLFASQAGSVLTGYILVTALRELGFPLNLKWPNDILLNGGKKVGGILLEEKNGIILAGLGLNLCEAPLPETMREEHAAPAAVLLPHHGGLVSCSEDDAPDASQRYEGEEPMPPFGLWRRLVSGAILAYKRSVAGRPLAEVLDDIAPLLAWKGQGVRLVEDESRIHCGRLEGLGASGGVRIASPGGGEKEFFSGSLSLTGTA